MDKIRNTFFRGLVTFLPMAITIYVLYAVVLLVENLLGTTLRTFLPFYVPGMGFVVTIALIFILGLILNNFFLSGILTRIEKKMMALPLFKAVYSPLRDLMNLFSKKGQKELKSVVLVDLGMNGIKAMGLVTRESFRDLDGFHDHTIEKVAVYIPISYGMGGFTFLVPKSQIKAVDIPIERAMSLALTGWVKTHNDAVESTENNKITSET